MNVDDRPQAETLIISLLTASAAVLQVLAIGGRTIWVDENYSLLFASRPVPELISLVMTYDVHPPTYYVFLRLWTQLFGYSELSLRSLSILFGTLTIPVFYLLAREFFARRGAFLATGLVAISPYLHEMAGMIRMYSLLLLVTVASYYTFIRLLDTWSRQWQLLYFLSSLILIYTHIMGLTVIAAQAVQAFARLWQTRSADEARKLLTPSLGLGVAFLPWVFVVLNQAAKLAEKPQQPLPGVIDFLYLQVTFTGGGPVSAVFGILPAIGIVATFGILSAVGIVIWAIQYLDDKNIDKVPSKLMHELSASEGTVPIAVVWFSVPIVLQFGFAYIIPRTFDYRHMIMSIVPLFLLVTFGAITLSDWEFPSVRSDAVFAVLVCLLIGASALAVSAGYAYDPRPDWEEGAAYVDERASSGATIAFDSSLIQRQFTYYSDRETEFELYGYPESSELVRGQKSWPGLGAVDTESDEIWFLASHASNERDFISTMNGTYVLAEKRNFDGLVVYRFVEETASRSSSMRYP